MIKSWVKTKEGREPIIAYSVDEVKLPMLTYKQLQRNHKIIKYATDYAVLDTETSHIDLTTAWVYQWAVKIKKTYIYGRTPEEFIDLLQKMGEHYKLSDKKRLILYIHNASYDLEYLKHYIRAYDPKANFLAIDPHTIIICDILGFRILCSYKLTNLSLAGLAKNYAKTYDKAVGEIDYNIVRYQDTELSIDSDWYYMFSDVAAQADGIAGYLETMGYKYAFEAPFTSTGFVRSNCRKASKGDPDWRAEFTKSALDLEQYNLCRWAFMGGVCIASFLYSNHTIRSDKLRHRDFTSSYPARQILDYAPTGAPSWYGEIDDREEFEDLLEEYCCIFELTLYNCKIKKGVTAPCIPSSKCIGLMNPSRLNGKIVSATRLTIAVTEIDYKWIKRQYTAENIKVDKMLTFKRGVMPEWLKSEIFTYFNNKCTLKGVNDLLYGKSKNSLNSIYGMTATSIIRDEYEIDADGLFNQKTYDDPEEANKKKLERYYKSFNSFMPYQYACYTTAWARDALYTMIEATGDGDGTENDLTEVYKNFLYCDTDSVFYIETEENKSRMDEYTAHCIDRAKKAGAFVGDKYLGVPTDEPPLRAFRALHSKCYAMEELNEKTGEYELQVVIAGIPKKSTKWIDGQAVTMSNAEELGNIDNLKDGFIFKHNGGARCVYNEQFPEVRNINGHITQISSSAVIDSIDKEISDTMWTVEGLKLLKLKQEQL